MRPLPAVAVVLVLALSASACATARAEGEGAAGASTDYARPGPYVGGGLLQSFENFRGVRADDSDFGLAVRGGVRLDPRFAVEGVAEGALGYEISEGGRDADLDIASVGVQGKVFVLTEEIQPYVLGGFGSSMASVRHFNVDGTGAYVRLGVGADWYLTPRTAVYTELNRNWCAGDIHRLDHTDFQVGVLFHF